MFSIGGSARCSRRRCQGVARRSILPEVFFSSVGAHDFFVHIQRGLRQPLLHTGMQLHTGTYARLVYTASPLPSLRVLRQWYSLRVRGWDTGPARHAAAFVRARDPGAGGQASVGGGRFHRGAAFARTHQCDSVISSSAAASKMVGPFSSSTLMTSGRSSRAGLGRTVRPRRLGPTERPRDGRFFQFSRGSAGSIDCRPLSATARIHSIIDKLPRRHGAKPVARLNATTLPSSPRTLSRLHILSRPFDHPLGRCPPTTAS